MPATFENWNSEDKPKDKNHTNLIHKASQAIKDRIIPPENPNVPRSEVRFHRATDRVVKSTKPDILRGVKRMVGRGQDTWEQITAKDNEDIYPHMVEWWMNHSEHILQYWPDEPDESHPYYPDWQIARSFVHEGKVSKSLVEKTFKDDPWFYAKTMQIRRLHALRLHAVMGQLTRIKDSGPVTADVLRQQARSHGVNLTNLDINGIKMWGALTTLLATANLVVTMAGGAVNFPHEALTTVANLGVVAAVGSAGVWASAKIAASAYEGMKKAVTEPNEFDRVTSACQQILDTVKDDNSLRHFMQATYGIDPTVLAIDPVTGGSRIKQFLTTHGIGSSAQETITFKDKIVSATGGWVATQEYLESEEKFRLLYLEKCVKVDTRRKHSLMTRFRGGHWEGQKPNIHLYEDEFLYHEDGSMIPGQSDALYEAKWNARFEQLAIARGIDLIPANAPTLRLLFFEAGQELAKEIGDERFKLIRNEISYRDASPDVQYTPEEMKKISDGWRAGGGAEKEGYLRAKYKKGLTTQLTETTLLRTGKKAEDGKPPIVGLEQAKAVIDSTDPSAPGLIHRKSQIESAYQEIITKAYEHLGSELEIRAKADELQRSQDLPGLDELQTIANTTYLSITKTEKDGLLFDAQASREGVEKAYNDKVLKATEAYDEAMNGTDKELKKTAATTRDKTVEIAQAIRDRDQKYYDEKIRALSEKADKLHALIILIMQKRNELMKMYDAMGAQNMNEAERVRKVHSSMVDSFTSIKPKVDEDTLLLYGTTGHEMDDFMTSITTGKSKPWTPDEGRTHEKRMAVLYAVAEAHARREVPAIKDVPKSGFLHEKILDAGKGGLTREQLVIMSPEEVYARVLVKLSLKLAERDRDIQSIREAIAHETTAYQARLRALQQVTEIQSQIEARLAKAMIEADEVCTARQERIEIIREMVMEDRGAIYNLGPELTRRDALTSYSDGTKVSGSDLAYEDAERTHSKGFVKFMQDVFGYHHFDFAYRRAGSADKGTVLSRMRMDTLRDETKSREGLFLSLLDALGTSPEHDLAKMISSSFPAFDSLLEPTVTADNLTFDQVMAVIAYRHDRTLPRPQFPGGGAFIAQERTYDLPVRPTDMRIVLRGVVGVLSDKALAGNI